ncbi:MAG TPA: hypothetical protein VFB43_16080 [Terracidiphilus sp.]|nr:hypothetical protein [Terracidiphilus sp.]
MWRPGFGGQFQHPLLLLFAVCLSDVIADLQLEQLLFSQTNTEQIALFTQDSKQEAHLFVDRLWRSTFSQTIILVFGDHSLIEVHQHLTSYKTLEMVDCVLREGCGIGEPQFVSGEELIRQFVEGANAFSPRVGDIVEALLKLPPTVLLRGFSEGL